MSTSDESVDAHGRGDAFPFDRARDALLHWFESHGRRFPWRDNPTPYRVWVSEIMLQQTTTQTALGYFERFLARFPDPQALASASEEEILALWQGLGYYRRAKALRNAAIEIVERFDGRVPDLFEDLTSLDGVGRYCAGAILSFGFDLPFAILEANTTRLHSRLVALESEPTRALSQKLLWRFAQNWLPADSAPRPKDFCRKINAALTDLGRLVCQPSNPQCKVCPLANWCGTNELGLQERIPLLKKRAPITPRVDVALWISRRDVVPLDVMNDDVADDVLMIRRPEYALWAGLWDFPRFEVIDPAFKEGERWRNDPELADRISLFLEDEIGAPPAQYRPGARLTLFRHSVTRYRIELSLCRLQNATSTVEAPIRRALFDDVGRIVPSSPELFQASEPTKKELGKPLVKEWRWVPISALKEYPLSSTGIKIAQFIQRYGR